PPAALRSARCRDPGGQDREAPELPDLAPRGCGAAIGVSGGDPRRRSTGSREDPVLMLLTVREFIDTARTAMPRLVERLQDETGRFNPEEETAWQGSLGKVATMFERADLGDFHVQLNGRTGNLALEYRLPAASSWCDLVVLGQGE